MLTLSIALLFSVAGVVAAMVLAHSIALAIPAWRETKAALNACPPCREAFVSVEYRFERPHLPRGRQTAPGQVRPMRRALRASQLNAAA